MSQSPRRRGFFSRLLGALDLFRRLVVNLVFLFVVVLVIVALVSGEGVPVVPEKAALVFAPEGDLVEQLTGDPVERALAKLTDSEVPEVLLWDVLDALEAAREDDRIQALYLDLDGLGGAGLPALREVREEIEAFREAGKPVVAKADVLTRNGYYLAAAADEIHLHEMGAVVLPAYGRFRTYYKEGMDKLGVEWHVYRHGDFKSGPEPYLRDDMSDEAEVANVDFLEDLWASWLTDVAESRAQLTPDGIRASMDDLVAVLEKVGGDTAQAALESGLVDHLAQRDTVRARLIEIVGQDDDHGSFRQISAEDYYSTLDPLGDARTAELSEDGVAVVIAKGSILDGTQPPGAIGGESTAELIREARRDDRAKAVLLRVDSGGGSSFASEVIRRELELVRDAGKPVVVSMASVAASGGYWISTSSDEIWASPDTITGSIGIYANIPNFDKAMEKWLGVRVDGVGLNWLSGVRLDHDWPEQADASLKLVLRDGYDDFLERVANARDMTVEEVHEHAQGRVWSGADAHARGLVDSLGGFSEALASTVALAGLPEDAPFRFVERELDFGDRLLLEMFSSAVSWLDLGPERRLGSHTGRWIEDLVSEHLRGLEQIRDFGDPRGLDVFCFCDVR